jgi:hypothetical protein
VARYLTEHYEKCMPHRPLRVEWACLVPYLHTHAGTARPRVHSLRQILDSVFYFVRTGCAWRLFPHDIPPCKTMHHFRSRLLHEAPVDQERDRTGDSWRGLRMNKGRFMPALIRSAPSEGFLPGRTPMSGSYCYPEQTTYTFMLPAAAALLLTATDQPVGVKDPSVSGAFLKLLIELPFAM